MQRLSYYEAEIRSSEATVESDDLPSTRIERSMTMLDVIGRTSMASKRMTNPRATKQTKHYDGNAPVEIPLQNSNEHENDPLELSLLSYQGEEVEVQLSSSPGPGSLLNYT